MADNIPSYIEIILCLHIHHICVYMCIHVYMCIYMHACVFMYIHTCVSIVCVHHICVDEYMFIYSSYVCIYTHVYAYVNILFIYSGDKHWVCFHFVAFILNSAFNTHVQVLYEHIFSVLVGVISSEIDMPYDTSVLNFLRDCQIVF